MSAPRYQGPARGPKKPTRASDERAAERRRALKCEGRCIKCGRDNDRAGEVSKNGQTAAFCTRCKEEAEREAAAARARAKLKVNELRRSLGLPDEG